MWAQSQKVGQDLANQANDNLADLMAMLGDADWYAMVVTNSAGSVTSLVATLSVALRPPPPTTLKIDFNDTAENTAAQTEPGFRMFALPAFGPNPVTRIYGGAEVTVAGAGVTLES